MALKLPTQGNPSPYIIADTFADIPFDAATGLFLQSGTFGEWLVGQQIFCLDDFNRYEVVSLGAAGTTIVSTANRLTPGVAGASLARGILVSQSAVTGKWILNAGGADTPCSGVTPRAIVNNLVAPIITSGPALVLVANAQTINPGAKFSCDAAGLATVNAVTKPCAISIDTAPRVGNGTTVFVLATLTPLGN